VFQIILGAAVILALILPRSVVAAALPVVLLIFALSLARREPRWYATVVLALGVFAVALIRGRSMESSQVVRKAALSPTVTVTTDSTAYALMERLYAKRQMITEQLRKDNAERQRVYGELAKGQSTLGSGFSTKPTGDWLDDMLEPIDDSVGKSLAQGIRGIKFSSDTDPFVLFIAINFTKNQTEEFSPVLERLYPYALVNYQTRLSDPSPPQDAIRSDLLDVTRQLAFALFHCYPRLMQVEIAEWNRQGTLVIARVSLTREAVAVLRDSMALYEQASQGSLQSVARNDTVLNAPAFELYR
jgi:hypothetical protein